MSAPALKDIWPGQSVPLLKALHILTHNGGLNADCRRKLKQVQHLAQLIKPAIDAVLKEKEQPVLADLGAGKSYLGFILYDLYFGPADRGNVIAVEARPELIATAKKIAEDSGFSRMDFVQAKSLIPKSGQWISLPRFMLVTPPPTKRSCSRSNITPNMSRWCPAARPNWRSSWTMRRDRWRSFGVIPFSGGNSAPISPMCCGDYFLRRKATRCGSPN